MHGPARSLSHAGQPPGAPTTLVAVITMQILFERGEILHLLLFRPALASSYPIMLGQR